MNVASPCILHKSLKVFKCRSHSIQLCLSTVGNFNCVSGKVQSQQGCAVPKRLANLSPSHQPSYPAPNLQVVTRHTWTVTRLPLLSPTPRTTCSSGCASLPARGTPLTSTTCCCGVDSTCLPSTRARAGDGSPQVGAPTAACWHTLLFLICAPCCQHCI